MIERRMLIWMQLNRLIPYHKQCIMKSPSSMNGAAKTFLAERECWVRNVEFMMLSRVKWRYSLGSLRRYNKGSPRSPVLFWSQASTFVHYYCDTLCPSYRIIPPMHSLPDYYRIDLLIIIVSQLITIKTNIFKIYYFKMKWGCWGLYSCPLDNPDVERMPNIRSSSTRIVRRMPSKPW